MRPIGDVAADLGIPAGSLETYGEWKAKLDLTLVPKLSEPLRGKLILITGMTPTPFGEGKTVTAIGVGMGLAKLGKRAAISVRQPSLGPTFGVKGGAAGGGRCTVEPMQDINLGFTGDIDAIGAAHNLLAAMVDNHIFHGNALGIDSDAISWPRVLDMNERALRAIRVGLGETKQGVEHDSSFMITAASEVMAALGLSRDYADLKARLGRIIVATNKRGEPVTAADLKAVGAMAALLKRALRPNLVQTAEGTPALVHGGPFGNIAHGTSSIASILLGLRYADYTVVEAGFATDLGAEKFVDIVTRTTGVPVDAAVIVATVKALRYHGGVDKNRLDDPNAEAVARGIENLAKHVENVRLYGLTPIVALNRFPSDTDEEVALVFEFSRTVNVPFAVSTAFADGGEGATRLAELVVAAAAKGEKSRPVYSLGAKTAEKIEKVVRDVYGGKEVKYEPRALDDLERISKLGLDSNPICVAKTPLSFSDDAGKLGRPRGFTVTVKKVRAAAGAGFNVVYMGDIVTMPGLPSHPLAEEIDLSDDGTITGLR
ncbi:MAG: formate--tetrahydrofolate ligase [Thaumarchaeota archaeon]|nr:formate--tetrahydrofolate ligase [Nitrososphaerota archaeon]